MIYDFWHAKSIFKKIIKDIWGPESSLFAGRFSDIKLFELNMFQDGKKKYLTILFGIVRRNIEKLKFFLHASFQILKK